MRYLLPLFFVLLNLTALAAQEVIEQGYGIELAPHYGSRRISGSSGLDLTVIEARDSIETGTPGYGVGFVYTSRVNRIGFTTGIRYLETGYSVGEQAVTNGDGASFSQEVRARYLSIPFELNFYQDITPKDRVFFTLGTAAHLHLATRVRQRDLLEGAEVSERLLEDDPELNYRSPVISLNTAIGFDRKINERWSVRLEPYFQFFLQSNLRADFAQTNRNYYQVGTRVLVRRFF